ncbi:T9SS type A sorting domain-containing protein [Aequorivita xiaoshiensis]|uniref:T9SS type A sorting domain-containing protein n=1 Tax=Aequorivita xiaoshiensis TaxID=2874476 RepID=A0A9X1R307_9FLAO|nr:T9SS type A sorting domain-containing protein [Aequorivita xiaoshiensis]MCG2430104.1 T9SS type A sorting domain-containing protein [Aequorivita xiaoshiensis]
MDYEYDQDGNLTTRKNYNSFGGSTFELGGIYKYFYTSNNQLESWELYFNETDLIEVGTVTYNAEGKKLEELGTMGVSNQNLFANNLRMFPNPATDQFTIFSDKNIITAVDIVDTTGKVVLKETNLSVKEATLNTSTLQSGVYYIRVVSSKGIVTNKLVVQ